MAKYRVQHDGDVDTIDEARLRKKLRGNDLTGLELVRREDDEQWVPLCETELFREEVPFRGRPLDAARRRDVQGFAGHLTGWTITAGIMGALGSWFPFWLMIWGVFLLIHGAKVAPSAIALLGTSSRASLPSTTETPRDAVGTGSGLADKVARIRDLLRDQKGEPAERLTRAVDQLAATLREIGRRRADLESQLAPSELGALETAREEARLRLESAPTAQDRDLSRQELTAVDQRHEAVQQAQRTLARLRSRERVAEHQLEQLRLDLTRARAHELDVPDFAAHVEGFRLEAAAFEEVEEALATSRRDRDVEEA